MNQRIWAISIGLSLASCGLPNGQHNGQSEVQSQPVQSRQSNARVVSPQPGVDHIAATPPPASPSIETVQAPQFLAQETSIPQQDYEPTAPLPATGQVTIRDHIRNLDPDRLITDCPSDSAPYAFAESTHYRIQICSEEYDPWQPKYYLQQAKDGSEELRITSSDPAEARQLIFQSEGHTHILYRDATRPGEVNAYLQMFMPDGDSYAEALLYFYEASSGETFE